MNACSNPNAVSPLRAAMEARDVSAVCDAFAPDAVFHSPLTEGLAFKGREQIGLLTSVLFEVFEDFNYTDGVVSGDVGFLVARARVGGQPIEIVDHGWARTSASRRSPCFSALCRRPRRRCAPSAAVLDAERAAPGARLYPA